MRTLISLAVAVFVLGFIFSADLIAEEEWEKKLKADGWVLIKRKLTDLADTTWYGQKSANPSREHWIFYIAPSGEKAYFQFIKDAPIHKSTRSIDENGRICNQWEKLGGGIKRCGRTTLWKKGDLYMTMTKIGSEHNRWKIKKGNLEKFK